MKHLIIGGVAGGATAAARIRRLDETADIIVFERGPHISYANCGLPYHIGGVIAERHKLLLHTPESFGQRFNIDVRVRQEVVKIDTERKIVTVRPAEGEEYEESYDRLLLSPGASPVRPPLPGIESEGIFTLRTVEDTDRIKAYVNRADVSSAVVVGGGFIGLEMAENLRKAGLHVTVVEAADQVMAPLDFSMASFVHRELLEQGVELYLEQGVTHFDRADDGLGVHLNDGTRLSADLVLLSIGVRPETQLAAAAGLELGERGIRVDAFLRTSAPDVYAVGDAIEFPHPVTGQPWCNFLAGPANRQARLVADNMVRGDISRYEGSVGTAIAKVFDLTVATTGLAGKHLRRMGIDYRSSVALMIKRGGTVYELTELEHAYAPPFSSAKDPVAIAGYVASNIVDGEMPAVTWREVAQLTDDFLLDVRTPAEVSRGKMEGAVNIPLDELRNRLDELPRDRRIVVTCAVGLRGYLALRILRGNGFEDVANLSGGYVHYAIATQELGASPCLARLHYPQDRAAQPWRGCMDKI